MAQKSVFSDENVVKHFSGLICLKLNDGKIAKFLPKPWTNPFGKIFIFGFFQLPVV